MRIKFLTILLLIFSFTSQAQSDVENAIKAGEIILTGLTIFKVIKSNTNPESKVIESVCVKNKLIDKITFKITGKNEEGVEIKKELIIQKEGKECIFELLKGIYTYEIILSNNEIYKKGEYKFNEEIIITVKDN